MRPLPKPHLDTYLPWDILFMLAAACYAWLAYRGIIPMSGSGASLDSDLQTYAQGMAGDACRAIFSADPVLDSASPANSIPNLERWLGLWLAPPQEWATGLLCAGAIAIFVFYAGWYLLGRWLYQSPALAALLAVVCGITIWAGWGTFWGISHSDPVPRVFFGALMPFLLWLAFVGISHPGLRPVAMFAAGTAIWVHGVSALNCGAMFFAAFFFMRPKDFTIAKHLWNLSICLFAFFLPVLIFLWPSLHQHDGFPQEQLALFQEVFNLRWSEDYGNFSGRILKFFSPTGQVFPVLAGGLVGWLVTIFMGSPKEKRLCLAAPCFLLALLLVACFCWLETRFAPNWGRLPMGHELVRGMRLLVPVAWLLAVAGIGCLSGKILRRLLLVCAICAVVLISRDRQLIAAQYAVASMAGVASAGEIEAQKAAELRSLFLDIRKIVPEGEAVYCPEDAMQVRYIALRPLAHSFKDGYVHFYNKDIERSRNWLKLERLAQSGPEGYLDAWRASGAPWLLCRANADKASLNRMGEVALDKGGWLLVRAKR